MKTVVIGAGLGGLAAAIQLAHGGQDVTLLEKNDHLGGKINVIEDQGFRFDKCPTILTFPQVLDRLFHTVGRRREDYLDLVPLDPQWRAFFEDGTTTDVWGNVDRMEEEIRRIHPADVEGFRRFRRYAERMHSYAEKFFFWRSVGDFTDVAFGGGLGGTQGLGTLVGMDLHRTVAGAISRHFQDPRLRQLFEHFMQYVGSSPWKAPAILASIHHIQLSFGVWYPRGGMNRLARALEQLAADVGVRVKTGVAVERIVTAHGRVTGVEAGGNSWPADAVVSNADHVRTHLDLLPQSTTTARLKSRNAPEPSCSGVTFYFGLNRRYDRLWHHDFFFSRDPRREFTDIYDQGVPTSDPTLCVCAPSRTDPTVAPAGCENVYVLVHTPYLRPGQDWSKIVKPYRDLVVQKLERMGLEGFSKAIQVEHVQTPGDLEQTYRLDRGAIYGVVSHGRLAGGFKPANRSKEFPNLYFAGGSVNPGPGVPMALMSGQIAAAEVLKDCTT